MADRKEQQRQQLRDEMKFYIDSEVDGKLKNLPPTTWKSIIRTIGARDLIALIVSICVYVGSCSVALWELHRVDSAVDRIDASFGTLKDNTSTEILRLDRRIDAIKLPSPNGADSTSHR